MLTPAQTYQALIDKTDEHIKLLMNKRSFLVQHLRASKITEVLAQDAAWLVDAKNNPRDWRALLKTSNSSRLWSNEVPLQGVSGMSEWASVDERAITLRFYEEMPDRVDVLSYLLEQMFPCMQPWEKNSACTGGGKFVNVATDNQRYLLGHDSAGAWLLMNARSRRPDYFDSLKAAVGMAQKTAAQKFFEDAE